MGKKRIIDSDSLFFKTKLHNLIGDRGYLLYIRVWALAEDWGGYEADYGAIALQTGVLRCTEDEVQGILEKLVKDKKVIPYSVSKRTYHWIINFLEHQTLNNPSPSKIPLPPWIIQEIKQYKKSKSKRKFARFTVDESKIPTDYQYAVCSLPVDYNGDSKETEDKEPEVNPPKKQKEEKAPKKKYGEFKHVLLTDAELKKIVQRFGMEGAKKWIKTLDEGVEMKPKKYSYANHYLALLKWAEREGDKKAQASKRCVYDNKTPCFEDCNGCNAFKK